MKRSMCIDVRRHRLCAKNTNMSRRKANTNTIRQYTICNTHFSFTIYFIGGFAHRSLCFFMFYFIIIIISAIKPNKPCTYNVWAPFYTRPIRSKWMRAAASAMKRGNIKTRYIEINFNIKFDKKFTNLNIFSISHSLMLFEGDETDNHAQFMD